MKNFLDDKWIFLGAWPGVSLNSSMIWHGSEAVKIFHDEFGIWRGLAHTFIGRGHTAIMEEYISESLKSELFDWLKQAMMDNPQGIISSLNKYYDYLPIYREEVRTLASRDPSTLTKKELAFKFSTLRFLQSKVTLYDQFGMYSEHFFDAEVEEIFSRRDLDADTVLEMQNGLTAPFVLSSLQQERRAILFTLKDLLLKKNSSETLIAGSAKDMRLWLGNSADEELKYLVDNFGWIPVFVNNPSWGEDHFIRQILDLVSEFRLSCETELNISKWVTFLDQQINELDRIPEVNRKRAEEISKSLDLNENELYLFEAYRLAMNTRNECEYQVGIASIPIQSLIPEICTHLKIDVDMFHCLYTEEVVQLLEGSITLDDIPISRLIVSGNWFKGGKNLSIMTHLDARAFRDRHRIKAAENLKEERVGGIGVSKGLAEGQVCIIRGPADFSKFQKGNILVAECTTADYASLMRLAGGIITEHGGRTCHAAIISRELEIPAIVGYRSAMTIFRDGQKIRFNASEGVAYPIE